MKPVCPGQCDTVLPQVWHSLPLSDTPNAGSCKPPVLEIDFENSDVPFTSATANLSTSSLLANEKSIAESSSEFSSMRYLNDCDMSYYCKMTMLNPTKTGFDVIKKSFHSSTRPNCLGMRIIFVYEPFKHVQKPVRKCLNRW